MIINHLIISQCLFKFDLVVFSLTLESQFKKKYAIINQNKLTFDQAAKFCEQKNGVLPQINSEEEYEWIKTKTTDSAWLGAFAERPGSLMFKWTADNSSVNFDKFNYLFKPRACEQVLIIKSNGMLINECRDQQHLFICEFKDGGALSDSENSTDGDLKRLHLGQKYPEVETIVHAYLEEVQKNLFARFDVEQKKTDKKLTDIHNLLKSLIVEN